MATKKCQFRLPTELMAEVDQLLSAEKGVGLAGALARSAGRFSRDRFVSDVLDEELSRLEGIPTNSRTAVTLLREDMLEARERLPYKKLNISLEQSVAERLGTLCSTKGIPRDELMRVFLSHVVAGLREAQEMANNPTSSVWLDGEPYRQLYLSQDDVDERAESLHVIEAIAVQKGVSFGVAHHEYWKRSRAERQRLRSDQNIRSAVAALKKRSAARVDLSEFLPPAEQRRLRMAAAKRARRSKQRRSR